MCNKLIVAYLTNETLRNANDFHFILSDNHLVTKNSFNTIHNCYKFYKAVDCCYFANHIKQI